jgi:hypothetical protein
MTKRDAKALLRKVESSITGIRAQLGTITRTMDGLYVRMAVAIEQGAPLSESIGEDWREWAEGATGIKAPTVYRYRNAGVIAQLLGATPDDLPESLQGFAYTALVPLYRILKAAEKGTEQDQEQAVLLVRSLFEQACSQDGDSAENVATLVEQHESGTRGKKGVSSDTRKKKKAAAKKASQGATEQPDQTATVAATAQIERYVARVAGDDPEQRKAVTGILLAGQKFCETFGVEVTYSALQNVKKANRK